MLSSTPRDTSFDRSQDTCKQEKNDDVDLQKQIEQEELKFKAAIRADRTFEVVKAIREKIKVLKQMLK
ncbi:hypothetical protein [Segetibacter aerophilus]|uniref:Uncharacterized protein n=1 Tax=Segetibacter aerophilus TaxID=670293 RepID=A0A512BC13_9BACT|nr:hypothetical protein [Segetibacter aerophilus]GEO09498.1 hypothetical protein SAE01_19940 [Segetibacter aerophilus]